MEAILADGISVRAAARPVSSVDRRDTLLVTVVVERSRTLHELKTAGFLTS